MADVEVYARDAARFFELYESLTFERAHRAVRDVLPERFGTVLDVGAGSGRDAAWFAAHGADVFAVEPAGALRDLAVARHRSPRIHWVDDALPGLPRIRSAGSRFDLIWLSAVWMHVPPGQRSRAFRVLADLLAPGGRLFVSLRHGAFGDGRTAHPVAAEELLRLGREHGLVCVHHAAGEAGATDALGRADVRWESLIFRLPDDGSGAFPTLRNIILNDAKSGTYKLALLRSLLRIASGGAGYSSSDGNGDVLLPLGLVALYWVRMYRPLLAAGLRQRPGERELGFAKAPFHALEMPSPDLKPGLLVSDAQGAAVHGALRDAARTIRTMPATYITWPGTDLPIFETRPGGSGSGAVRVLDEPTLARYGTLRVPASLWKALRFNAAWIEPVIESEWVVLMRRYDPSARSDEDYRAPLRWIDPRRDTESMRSLAERLRGRGGALHCTWSGARLRNAYEVDHVIPWVRWPCNDLWNLVPVSGSVNAAKNDRLPSADLLVGARERLCSWWSGVLAGPSGIGERFRHEVRATLPFVRGAADVEEVFDALLLLRASLRREQQIPEWPSPPPRTSASVSAPAPASSPEP